MNGQALKAQEPVPLKPGDSVGVAKFVLHFQDDARSEVEKLTGGMNLEETMMVDSEAMAKAYASVSEAAPGSSGPRKLVVLKGEANTKELPIERDVITIGKADSCDLVIKGFFLDKIEATLSEKGGKFTLTPLGGSVRLNEEKVEQPTPLKLGDTFSVGKTTIAFT